MKTTLDIMAEWEHLLEHAKNECIFGEPLDIDLFRECMKDAGGFFSPEQLKAHSFDIEDLDLYGQILAYSLFPIVEESENNELCEASQQAANDLANAINNCRDDVFENGKMIEEYEADGIKKIKFYDFETGDLSSYIEAIKTFGLSILYW